MTLRPALPRGASCHAAPGRKTPGCRHFGPITGRTLQELYESTIRAPRDIDFWLALPQSQEDRFEAVRPAQPTAEQLEMMSANQMSPDGLGALMFNGVNSLVPPNLGPYSPNRREVRAVGPAAVGGIGSARGLAQVYAAAIGLTGDALMDSDTLARMAQQQVWGFDRVLNFPTAFGVVFMKPTQDEISAATRRLAMMVPVERSGTPTRCTESALATSRSRCNSRAARMRGRSTSRKP